MNLAAEYAVQNAWRDWPRIFAALPDLSGQTVLDAGCAVGDEAAVLDAWQARFERMPLLKRICGTDDEMVRSSLLRFLGSPEHRSLTKVYSCFGRLERPC